MRIGIIGLPGSGKTTIFNALTRGKAQPGGYSAAKSANVGVAHVPDERLDALTSLYNPRKTTHAEVTYVDVPVVRGKNEGDWLAGEAVSQLQKMDALLLVVRSFKDDALPHVLGSIDWTRDIEKACFDVQFADISLIDRRIERLNAGMKPLKAAEREQTQKQIDTLRKLQADLEAGTPVRAREQTDSDRRALQDVFLLSALPLLVAVNTGEDGLALAAAIEQEAFTLLKGPKTGAAAICGKLEAELAQMPPEEEAEMRAGLGAGESGLNRMIKLSYQVIGLISFLTVGEDEVRAWPVPAGFSAPRAAGRVHSDIERGFIRAEVVSYDDLVAAGSLAEARKRGTLRQEGREYVIKDGDVVNFLFSV
ncbi:MAG: redox-regulated ATPase YchF [Dehalococcoidia bacterium]|nr:redox-regulated ATPase YchF [Dehalococcoidia bacterium]MSQ34548.1 redox-regulated ATPase YchF [Dehalococcoidia bacterium]